ncbi:MAG: hypothetical protein QXH27_04965 [Candidatus Micrarchaeia archaeon]
MNHHESHHAAAPPQQKPLDADILILAALVVGLAVGWLAAGYLAPKPAANESVLSLENASAKALLLLNQNFLAPQGVSATLVNASGAAGLYKITFRIERAGQVLQVIDAYLSPDGSLLFPQAINLSQKLSLEPEQPAQPPSIPKSDKPSVMLFVMSFCPYGIMAEKAMAPVVQALANATEIEPHFVIYGGFCAGGRCNPSDYCIAGGSLCSMHGLDELLEDVRQLCIWKHARAKFWDYVMYVDNNCSIHNIGTCWRDAANATGIDQAAIEACQQSEAEALLRAEASLNAQFGVQGSPTLVINGVQYEGSRTPQAFLQAVCGAFNNPPAGCNATLEAAPSSPPPSSSCG